MMCSVEKEFLTVRETARRLGVHENTVRNWVASGYLKSARLPGARFHRFEAAEVDRVAKSRGRPIVEPLLTARRVPELAGPEQLAWAAGEQGSVSVLELVDATGLSVWAERRDAQGLFPKLVRRLLVSASEVTDLSIIRSEEGIAAPGWDGRVRAQRGSLWVPGGASAWELGVDRDIRRKAQTDYDKRTKDPLGVVPAKTTFVFATPRRWGGAEKWARERKAEGVWADVRVIDADALEAWLEAVPSVHYWLSEEIGLRPRDALTLERWWVQFASRTNPRIPPELLLAGRDRQVEELKRFLDGSSQAFGIQAGSRTEAIAFLAAALQAGQDEIRPGVVVIKKEVVWDRLSSSSTPMVLVADFEDPPIATALAGGHHAVSPLGPEDIVRGPTVELPRIHRQLAEDALRKAEPLPGTKKLTFEEAGGLAGLARRSLTSFIRSRAVDPRAVRPRWGDGDAPAILAPLMLVGAFSSSDGDQAAVVEIVDARWDRIEQTLLQWNITDDPPFTRSGAGWHLTSPEEAFDVLHQFLTSSMLARWQRVALHVLAETDPDEDLEPEKRLFTRSSERPIHSHEIRRGIARGMALLGSLGEDDGPDLSGTFADHVDAIARELFAKANADESGLLWRSLSDELPALAEAAPRVFLEAVELGSSGEAPLLAEMFRDTSDQSLFFASSPHTGLLWALETVCWSADHLPEALLALAKLASIDPGGRLGNRPAGSLRSVLLPWVPYTAATVEQRLAAFKQVAKKYPEVGWNLLLDLLPKHHDHSSPTSTPRFRDWKPDSEGVTVAEWAAAVEGLVSEASTFLDEKPDRWLEIVDHLSGLPVHHRHRLLDELAVAVAKPTFSDDQKVELWRTIGQEVDHHREFQTMAQWVMDEESLVRLEAIAASLAPSDLPAKNAKLFDWRPRLEGLKRTDHPDYEQALSEAQNKAVLEVLNGEGFEGIRRLAIESPQAHFVGHALAEANGNADATELIPLLGEKGKDGEMARGWARRMAVIGGPSWIDATSVQVLTLGPDAQAAFLHQLPSGQQLRRLLKRVGEPVRDRYWRSVHPYVFDADETAFAIQEFISRGRPAAAIDLLSLRLHDDKDPPPGVTADLIAATLRSLLTAGSDEVQSSQHVVYSVGEVLNKLDSLGAPDQEIGQLEWAFFPLLEHSPHYPRALYAALKQDPAFFVDLVSMVYRGKNEQPRELDAAAAAQARNAWSVLHSWRDIPGSQDDGSIDREHLHRWVRQARLMLEERDRADIGDEVIGEILSGSPTGVDEAWPAETVRELIEDIGSRQLDTGLHIGKVNSRGVTTRGVYDGGVQERAIADGYRKWAKITKADWPRTTRLLEGLAESYERDAQRLDAEAEALGNRD